VIVFEANLLLYAYDSDSLPRIALDQPAGVAGSAAFLKLRQDSAS